MVLRDNAVQLCKLTSETHRAMGSRYFEEYMRKRIPIAGALLIMMSLPGVGNKQPPQLGNDARRQFPVPASVRVMRDIAYAAYGSRQLKLDVYVPSNDRPARRVPGILVVRGGGWQAGDKEAFGFIAGRLASEGFVATSIEYRTASEAKYPAAVHDLKAAVRWLRANASKFDVDPDHLGAIGGSAGGHLVALLGTSSEVTSLEGDGGNNNVSSAVQAVVAMACVCDLGVKDNAVRAFIGEPLDAREGSLREGSPIAHVDRRSAPLLLMHSPTDPVVPYRLSSEMQAKYKQTGVPVTLDAIDAPGTHAFWNDARYFPAVMGKAAAFFRQQLLR